MKKILILAILLLAVGCNQKNSMVIAPSPAQNNYTHQLQVGGQTLSVELATTPAQMEQGLSNRTSMEDSQGMLFDFKQQAVPNFWMKDMKFNLDFIWISQNKIIDITADAAHPVSASSPLPNYSPTAPVDMVLEVNAEWSKAHGIKVGDEVILK